MKTELRMLRKVPRQERIKAPIKWALANKFIGYGKKGSSTEYYKNQAIQLIDEAVSADKSIVFVSINGNPLERDYLTTYLETTETLRKGGVVLLDSKEYINGSTYNNGERRLRGDLLRDGYICQTMKACGLISIWNKNRRVCTILNDKMSEQVNSNKLFEQ